MGMPLNMVRGFTQLFFPHCCMGCGSDLLGENQLLCLECMARLPFTHYFAHAANPVTNIFSGRVQLAQAGSLFYFTKDALLQELLHLFKYKGKKEIGMYFGGMMGQALLASGNYGFVEALVPLPLFAAREKKRGYNQATLLCEGMALHMNVPYWANAVSRIRPTESQTHKNRVERWQNIAGMFSVDGKEQVRHRHLLLVDDVVTTGATLEACASALLEAGCASVSVATLAYTIG